MLAVHHAKQIVDELKSIIHRDINFMDRSGIIIASTDPSRVGTVHCGALQVIQNRLPSLSIYEDDPSAGVKRGINMAIFIDQTIVGVIGITGDPGEVSVFGDIIKRMTEIMMIEMRQREESDLLDRARLSFIESWLFASDPDVAELETRGQLLGFDITSPYTVAILQVMNSNESHIGSRDNLTEVQNIVLLRFIKNYIKEKDKNYCTIINNRIFILLYRCQRNRAYSMLKSICSGIKSYYGVNVCGGISNQSNNCLDIRHCYAEAKTACAVSVRAPASTIICYDQMSIEFITQSIPSSIRKDLNNLIFSSCSPEEKKEFTRTIQVYYKYDGSIKDCANALYIHRNTFQYRISRVYEKTGYSLKIPTESFLLFISTQDFSEIA
ncbi:MAG: helix-turn-helix domain-containing protein [Oscillospiraceae bacterium]|nr:helix-turn-helix domain-containing protein [Oscillospiraceae bacterium]